MDILVSSTTSSQSGKLILKSNTQRTSGSTGTGNGTTNLTGGIEVRRGTHSRSTLPNTSDTQVIDEVDILLIHPGVITTGSTERGLHRQVSRNCSDGSIDLRPRLLTSLRLDGIEGGDVERVVTRLWCH